MFFDVFKVFKSNLYIDFWFTLRKHVCMRQEAIEVNSVIFNIVVVISANTTNSRSTLSYLQELNTIILYTVELGVNNDKVSSLKSSYLSIMRKVWEILEDFIVNLNKKHKIKVLKDRKIKLSC